MSFSGSMPGSSVAVTLTVLASAVLHATWNALAHTIRDKLVGFVLIGLATFGCAAIAVFLVSRPQAGAWPWIAVSTLFHIGYQTLLLRTYQLGDFGQLYPIARGTSPLLVTLISIAVLGQSLSGGGILAILLICLGLAGLALADGLPGRALFAQARPHLALGLTGGVLSLVAYGLVVWAQSRGSLATVAALRETSIVIGAAIGASSSTRPSAAAGSPRARRCSRAGIAMPELTHG